ncbi:MAG: hypothetical protein QOD62_528, partial [Actinomycetota bacterium]|nr:hypothetical protein [Actinomycetota bacterium]
DREDRFQGNASSINNEGSPRRPGAADPVCEEATASANPELPLAKLDAQGYERTD